MKMRSLLLSVIVLLLLMPASVLAQPAKEIITLSRLRTEGLHNPLGLDTATPRFSWQLQASVPCV